MKSIPIWIRILIVLDRRLQPTQPQGVWRMLQRKHSGFLAQEIRTPNLLWGPGMRSFPKVQSIWGLQRVFLRLSTHPQDALLQGELHVSRPERGHGLPLEPSCFPKETHWSLRVTAPPVRGSGLHSGGQRAWGLWSVRGLFEPCWRYSPHITDLKPEKILESLPKHTKPCRICLPHQPLLPDYIPYHLSPLLPLPRPSGLIPESSTANMGPPPEPLCCSHFLPGCLSPATVYPWGLCSSHFPIILKFLSPAHSLLSICHSCYYLKSITFVLPPWKQWPEVLYP